jgi:hypothetical protein
LLCGFYFQVLLATLLVNPPLVVEVELLFIAGALSPMGGGVEFSIGYSTSSWVLNTWFFVVATHHLGGVASIYISGNLVVTGTHNSAVVIADSPNLIVGNWISFDRPFKGIIDSLLLLDKALTGVDVGLLYDTTHWPMPLCLEIHQLLSLLRHQPNSSMENLLHNHLHNF